MRPVACVLWTAGREREAKQKEGKTERTPACIGNRTRKAESQKNAKREIFNSRKVRSLFPAKKFSVLHSTPSRTQVIPHRRRGRLDPRCFFLNLDAAPLLTLITADDSASADFRDSAAEVCGIERSIAECSGDDVLRDGPETGEDVECAAVV